VSCFAAIGRESSVRAVIISGGEGRIFSAGLDLNDHADVFAPSDDGSSNGQQLDIGRRAWRTHDFVVAYQEAFNALERIPQPVIAAVGGACVGGGLDLICAADVRLASSDASFVLKEIDIGMVADVGVLQRARKIVGNISVLTEVALTARPILAEEALRIGLVSAIAKDRNALWESALKMASAIAARSPVAVRAVKRTLLHARDNTVNAGLDFVATLNMALLQSSDVATAAQAAIMKTKPIFANL
jgi:delta(3,5)-delta(2,4)-dienoyl-CoA isomerase